MYKGVRAIGIVDKCYLYSTKLFCEKRVALIGRCVYSYCVKAYFAAIFESIYNTFFISVHTVIVCKREKLKAAFFKCREIAFGGVEAVALVGEFQFLTCDGVRAAEGSTREYTPT